MNGRIFVAVFLIIFSVASWFPMLAFVIRFQPSPGEDRISAALEYGSYLYLAGHDESGNSRSWRLEKRLKADGSLDDSFALSGIYRADPTPGSDYILSVDHDSRYLYLAGVAGSVGMIQKLSLDQGLLDKNFGDEGSILMNFSGIPLFIHMVEGWLYVAAMETIDKDDVWRIERRLKTTGTLDKKFGGDGVMRINPTTSRGEMPVSLCADTTNFFVFGTRIDPDSGLSSWQIEKWNLLTNKRSVEFGDSQAPGVLVSKFPGRATSMVCEGEAIDLVGTQIRDSDVAWRIERRRKDNGQLMRDGSFGGYAVYNPSKGNDYPLAAASDGESLYVTGVDESLGDPRWVTLKWSLASGIRDINFGLDGFQGSNPSRDVDSPQAIAIDRFYYYLGGWDSVDGKNGWRFEKRDKLTGGSVAKSPLVMMPVRNLRFPRTYSSLVSLFFDPPVAGEDGYLLMRSSDGINYDFFVTTIAAPSTRGVSINWVDSRVSLGTTYWYEIMPFHDDSRQLTMGPSTRGLTQTQW